MRFTRHGYRDIAVGTLAFALTILVSLWVYRHYGIAWVVALPIFLTPFYGWLLWFFRDPERLITDAPGYLVSPADGVVTHLDEVDEPEFIAGRARRLSIFLSVLDVHINRMPAAGGVVFRKSRPGTYFDARREESLAKNRNQDVGLLPDDSLLPGKLLVRQSTGAIARNIVCPVAVGGKFARGERYGMIKFGSRTTLFHSKDREIEWLVKIGDRVKAGETVVARAINPVRSPTC
jgi:phosphatidylserine decarboxylase